jgi:8-oxo-dGTP diphosphatase
MLLAKRSAARQFYPNVWASWTATPRLAAPAQTLVREVEEELGVRAIVFEEIAVLDEPRRGAHGDAAYHVFVVTAWEGGEPRILGSEHSELGWFSLNQAVALPLAHPGYGQTFPRCARRPSRERGRPPAPGKSRLSSAGRSAP